MGKSRKRTRSLNLDVDKGIALAGRLPSILMKLEAAGRNVPAAFMQLAPLASFGATVLDELLEDEESDGDGDPSGFFIGDSQPDTGTLGAGRKRYLRSKGAYPDESVALVYKELEVVPGPAMQQVRRQVEFVLSILAPGTDINGDVQPSDKHIREAVDNVIEGEVLPQAIRDKFGDMIMFGLNTLKPRAKQKGGKP